VGRRQQVLQSIHLGYGVTMDDARFLLDWTHAAIRGCLLEQYDQPLGEIDVYRIADKFSFMPDIIACVGIEKAKLLMTKFAGVTMRFPSPTQLKRYPVFRKVCEKMEKDVTPDAINELAAHLRTSPDKIQQHFEHLQRNIGDGLLNDAPLYGSDDDGPSEMVAECFER
jgi:hypothetical protein